MIVHKSRCPALAGGVFPNPGKEIADILLAWLQGTPPPPASTATVLPPSPSLTIFLTAHQLQSLVICQKECGVSDEVFKAYLTATYQIQSRKFIPAAHYQTVLTWLTQQRDRRAGGEHTEMTTQPSAPAASPSPT
jgi:hypothetical protein